MCVEGLMKAGKINPRALGSQVNEEALLVYTSGLLLEHYDP